MPLRVHLLFEMEPEFREALMSRLNDDVVATCGPNPSSDPDYDILVAGRFEPSHLTASPHLKTVIIPFAGLPVKTRELLVEHPHLAVHNLHYNASMVAESAFALLLAAAKRIIPSDRALRRHDWTVRYEPYMSTLLAGKTALILGYGAIGQEIAKRCRAFDMTIIATRRHAERSVGDGIELHPSSDLPALLPRACALFVSLPLTPETEGLLGAEQLSLLPDRAVVVNIARGPIVNEEALYNELRSGRICAGIDVWYRYPDTPESRKNTPVSNFPFHELENVVMTPHMAENGIETESYQAIELASMLNDAAAGRTLPNRVDPTRGY